MIKWNSLIYDWGYIWKVYKNSTPMISVIINWILKIYMESFPKSSTNDWCSHQIDEWDFIWKALQICCPMIDWIILRMFIQSSIIGCPMIGYNWWDIIIWIMINLYMVILWMNDSWYHIRKSNCWLFFKENSVTTLH